MELDRRALVDGDPSSKNVKPQTSPPDRTTITANDIIAVVPAGSSYERSDIAVDITALPSDISVSGNVISKVLTEGAIGYKKITATKGGQLVGTVRLTDGSFPPLGTQVKNQDGKVLGIIGDQGFTYLSGISDADRNDIRVIWSQGQCSLKLPESLDLTSGVLLLPCH